MPGNILLHCGITGQVKFLLFESFTARKVVKGNNCQYPYKQGHDQEARQQN